MAEKKTAAKKPAAKKPVAKKAPAKKAPAKKAPVKKEIVAAPAPAPKAPAPATTEKKKGFNMPTSATLILSIIAVLAMLSWFIPGTEFDKATGEFTQGSTAELGFLNVIESVATGFKNRADLIVFIFALGGFMGLVMKSGMLEAMVGALIKKLNNREILLIPILMFIFAIGGSTFGLAEETLALAIVIIPVFILAGFDVITALAVLLIGPSLGVRASTTNPFGLGTAISSINTSAAGIGGPAEWLSMGDGIVFRLLAFVVFFVVLTLPVMWYAKRIKKDPSKSFTADINKRLLEKAKKDIDIEKLPEFTKTRKATMWVFIGAFVLLIMSVIPWNDFGISGIPHFTKWLSENKITRIFWGSVSEFGGWWFIQLTMLFVLLSIVVGFINRWDEKTILRTFYAGAKDLFGVAMIIAISAGVGVILADSGLQYTILEGLINMLQGVEGWLLILAIFMIIVPLSFLIPSTSGLAGTVFPILGATVYTTSSGNADFGALSATAFMFGVGILGPILPTSSVVMGLMEIADIGYERWLKPGLIMVAIGFTTAVILLITFGLAIG